MTAPLPVILHLCSDYVHQAVHAQLVDHLRGLVRHQTVYFAARSAAEVARPPVDDSEVAYRFRHLLKPAHRLLFRTKVRSVARAVTAEVDLRGLSVVHAHYLYSDGAVALKLHTEAGVPYVVAVRNTDVNFFMRLRPDLNGVRDEVLRRAGRVVFLSPRYRERLLSRLSDPLRAAVEQKASLVPNGLAALWLEPVPAPRPNGAATRLLYVGNFNRNKNILGTLRAAAQLAQRLPLRLTLVGGGGDGSRDVMRALESGMFPFARYDGRIDEPARLRQAYREHDVFVMPSFHETFGVAYIEALSQGLPVLHARGEGVDGFFPAGTVTEAVDPSDVESITSGLAALCDRRERVRIACMNEARRFDWRIIARDYARMYGEDRQIA